MARTEIDEARIDDEPVVRVGSRFLPVPATLLPPLVAAAPGAIDIPVPAGTPVYATEAGRITHAEGAAVGEVVVRGEDGTRFHYRRLLPSTVTVAEGQTVDAGSVLGLVATASSGAALGFGIQSSDGTWHDAAERMVGLADPAELFLLPPVAGDPALVAELPSQRRPARAARSSTAEHPRTSRVRSSPAPQPTPDPAAPSEDPAPAPEPATPTVAEPTEPTPASQPAQPAVTTSEPESQPAQPAAATSAADRLTRRRPRAGGSTKPSPATPSPPATEPPEAEAPTNAPPTESSAPPAVDDTAPPSETDPPVPETHTIAAPDPTPDADEESDDDTDDTDDERASALLVSRRRRPRGKR